MSRTTLRNVVVESAGHSIGVGLVHGLAIHLPVLVLAPLAGVVTGGLLAWTILLALDARRRAPSTSKEEQEDPVRHQL